MSSGTPYGGGGFGGFGDMLSNFGSIEEHADNHSGSSGDRSLFSSALGMIAQNSERLQGEDVDEQHAVNAHQKFYGDGGNTGEATSSGMGAAAAMQALKMFNNNSSSSGGGSSQEFMGMAMAQAAKLFDQQNDQGNVSSGASKQSAVQQAGEMALKMYMKSEMGGSSGGASGLMGMASKFL